MGKHWRFLEASLLVYFSIVEPNNPCWNVLCRSFSIFGAKNGYAFKDRVNNEVSFLFLGFNLFSNFEAT